MKALEAAAVARTARLLSNSADLLIAVKGEIRAAAERGQNGVLCYLINDVHPTTKGLAVVEHLSLIDGYKLEPFRPKDGQPGYFISWV